MGKLDITPTNDDYDSEEDEDDDFGLDELIKAIVQENLEKCYG